jgi:hypothetical protein
MKPNAINQQLIQYTTASSLQRLGFILEEVLNKKELSERILTLCKKAGIKFYLIPLKASEKKNKELINEKWKLIVNAEIEIDD